ncbi:hypothetical protein Ssi03_50750 [Sphaerisporangium siamense]|uniref:Putative membrane protein n=1 Tax=Sphaerisporangium siamense TaxID=795645 RepID=A0A7W7GCQ4_9ACTN|nr:hypothetical protein [Sphaerisporangium siamense]MBB4702221.1 putative membrane protein [Sphaerisporangium siamense]GII87085.1 hypothetical protein Ssi03_50750 [Sphaerisporangium siamense]
MEDKLNDIERDNLRKAVAKLLRFTMWIGAAAVACTAAAIWFSDWRLAGIAGLAWLGVLALYLLMCFMSHPDNEATLAKHIRTAERAKKAKEEQRRRHVEDLERDLFGAES